MAFQINPEYKCVLALPHRFTAHCLLQKTISPGCFEGASCSTTYCRAEEAWGSREGGTWLC